MDEYELLRETEKAVSFYPSCLGGVQKGGPIIIKK